MIGLSSLVEISGSPLCKALDQPITGDIAYDHNINFHATEASVSVKKMDKNVKKTIQDAPASHKSSVWKTFGFPIDEATGVVKNDETVLVDNVDKLIFLQKNTHM